MSGGAARSGRPRRGPRPAVPAAAGPPSDTQRQRSRPGGRSPSAPAADPRAPPASRPRPPPAGCGRSRPPLALPARRRRASAPTATPAGQARRTGTPPPGRGPAPAHTRTAPARTRTPIRKPDLPTRPASRAPPGRGLPTPRTAPAGSPPGTSADPPAHPRPAATPAAPATPAPAARHPATTRPRPGRLRPGPPAAGQAQPHPHQVTGNQATCHLHGSILWLARNRHSRLLPVTAKGVNRNRRCRPRWLASSGWVTMPQVPGTTGRLWHRTARGDGTGRSRQSHESAPGQELHRMKSSIRCSAGKNTLAAWTTIETRHEGQSRPGAKDRDIMPGQRSGGCEIRTREGLPPTRFPSLRLSVHTRSVRSATSADGPARCSVDVVEHR